jgi:DNA modification methylase
MFINIGDKYAGGGGGPAGRSKIVGGDPFPVGRGTTVNNGSSWGFRNKSLLGIPWRYAIGCVDNLGLILREEVIWNKTNGLPESVKDRCRRSHEQVFHFTKEGDYYTAIDRIRSGFARDWSKGGGGGKSYREIRNPGEKDWNLAEARPNPGGKLPGSVWDTPASWPDILRALPPELAAQVAENMDLPTDVWNIPLAPLLVHKHLAEDSLDGSEFDFDHFAAFPPELPAKVILGFSPKDVCTKCGHGRFPVSVTEQHAESINSGNAHRQSQKEMARGFNAAGKPKSTSSTRILGNACACTPYIDHPGNRRTEDFEGNGHPSRNGGEWKPWQADDEAGRRVPQGDEYGRLPVREYLLDQWEPAPATPGVVLDPCGGTGTTAITAAKMSRRGITCDLGFDYAKYLVDWRTYDLSQNRRK